MNSHTKIERQTNRERRGEVGKHRERSNKYLNIFFPSLLQDSFHTKILVTNVLGVFSKGHVQIVTNLYTSTEFTKLKSKCSKNSPSQKQALGCESCLQEWVLTFS